MEEESSLTGSPDIVSVLKPPRPRIPLKDIMSAANDEDNTANRKRRVSFANVNKIKEFSAGAESMVVCHTPAYEEPFSMSSDSSYPSGVDGATPAKGMFATSEAHATEAVDQKEQFPPQLGAFYMRNSLGVANNSTLHFPTTRQSLGGMDMTDCIDNHLELVGSSTRYSVGMDLTNVQGEYPRNITRYSMGMDLTNAAQCTARNSTRYSVGMDLTSVVGQDSRMSLSSGAMDFTKAAMSQQYVADRSVNLNPGNMSGVNLDESSGLDITEAIKDPLQFASLYTVNNAEGTRYSMNGMDLTNCANRRSTRFSLVNMDLTDTISEGNNSGLEFTEVINNPIIETTSIRCSSNNMELTEAAGRKSCSRLSTNSNYADVSAFNLEYSASSETSMDFTRPVHNADHYLTSGASSRPSNTSELRKELDSERSTCSAEADLQEPLVFEEKTSGSKTQEEVTNHDLAVTSNKSYVMPEIKIEEHIQITKPEEPKDQKLSLNSFEGNATKPISSDSTTPNRNLNSSLKGVHISQSVNQLNKSECLKNNELNNSKNDMNEVLLNSPDTPADENIAIINQGTELHQPNNESLSLSTKSPSETKENSFATKNVSQTIEPLEEIETYDDQITPDCDHIKESNTVKTAQGSIELLHSSKRKGRKSMAAGNLETLSSEFQDASSMLDISAMSIEDENEEKAAIKEPVEMEKESTVLLPNHPADTDDQIFKNIHEESNMDVSLNDSIDINNTIEMADGNRETNLPHRDKETSFSASSSSPSSSKKTTPEVCRDEDLTNESLHVSLVSINNSVDQSFGQKNITITRGAASRFSSAFPLRDLSIENERESSFSTEGSGPEEPSKGSVTATSDTTHTSTSRKGKRSFEVALESENNTEESPIKQVCLSRDDLISNVTAPSFLMENLDIPNETFTHSNKSHEISAVNTEPHSPLSITTQISPAKTQITLTHENNSQISASPAVHDITNITINKAEKSDFVNNFSLRNDITTDQNKSSLVQDESINVEISRTPRKMVLTQSIPEIDVPKVSSDDDSLDFNNHPITMKALTTKRCGLSLQPQKVPPSINKLKSRPTELFDDLSNKSEEELQEILKCYVGPKENNMFRNNRRIRHVKDNKYICDLVEDWIQLHFSMDSKEHIIESSYKLTCDSDKAVSCDSDRSVGEFLMQQMITHMPPQTADELLSQLKAPAVTQLARFGNQLSSICLFHEGKLVKNILTIQVVNVRKHFWAFVEINVKYQNFRSSDITIAEQRIGELKLSKVREIFNTTQDGPDKLFSFVTELSKLKFG